MKKLYKDEDNGLLGGVLLGLSEYFEIDVAFLRIGYCLFTLITGLCVGILVYIIAVVCIPEDPELEKRRAVLRSLSDDLRNRK